MKFEKIEPGRDETYEIAYDDHCLVVKNGENKVWISKAMARWISLNFAERVPINVTFVD